MLHLPVIGFGDGGVFTTVSDVRRLWSSLVEDRLGDDMLTTNDDRAGSNARYGMGMWLDKQPGRFTMEGMDAGVSFKSTRFPTALSIACCRIPLMGHGPWRNISRKMRAESPELMSEAADLAEGRRAFERRDAQPRSPVHLLALARSR